MINTKDNRKNLYVNLDKNDYITKLRSILNAGYKLRAEDGRFIPGATSMSYNTPWVYTKAYPGYRCDIAHSVFWELLHHIPNQCRKCYKVVVRPRTLEELFNLYELQEGMGVPCKCGMELRDTVHGLYGGYFYCKGLEEGKERYEQVRKLVDEKLSTETIVILKRYCTEFELEGIPSDQTPDCTEEELIMEEQIYFLFPTVGASSQIPDHVKTHVMRRWIDYAYKNGDETYKLFTDGSPLFKPYVTYHRKEKGENK